MRFFIIAHASPVSKGASGGGRWVTINGSPVFIQGGKITKGPARLVGSTAADVEKPSKSTADRKEELKKKYGSKLSDKKNSTSNKSPSTDKTKAETPMSKGKSSTTSNSKTASNSTGKTKTTTSQKKSGQVADSNKNGTVSYNGKEYSYEVKGNHVITKAPNGTVISEQDIADKHLGNVKSFVQSSFGPSAKTSNMSSERLAQQTSDLLEGIQRGDSTAQRQASYYFQELANRNISTNKATTTSKPAETKVAGFTATQNKKLNQYLQQGIDIEDATELVLMSGSRSGRRFR